MVAIVDRGTTPNGVGIGSKERVAAVSAVPGGSWTRTIMVPCGRLAWVATWPLICCDQCGQRLDVQPRGGQLSGRDQLVLRLGDDQVRFEFSQTRNLRERC